MTASESIWVIASIGSSRARSLSRSNVSRASTQSIRRNYSPTFAGADETRPVNQFPRRPPPRRHQTHGRRPTVGETNLGFYSVFRCDLCGQSVLMSRLRHIYQQATLRYGSQAFAIFSISFGLGSLRFL